MRFIENSLNYKVPTVDSEAIEEWAGMGIMSLSEKRWLELVGEQAVWVFARLKNDYFQDIVRTIVPIADP